MGKLLMGYWDCSYCGTKKNRGDARNCPNCGSPRDDDVTFYMDETSCEINEPGTVNKNPDWLCSYCGALNSDSTETCPSCGHSRDESDLNYFENKQKKEDCTEYNGTSTYPDDDIYDRSYSQETYEQTYTQRVDENDVKTKQKPRTRRIDKKPIIIAAAAILLCALLLAIFIPKTKTITVSSLPWERTIAVEAYKTVRDSSWDSTPAGAWDISEKQEIRSYNHVLGRYETKTKQVSEQVFDGYDISYSYKDLGNGMFEQVEHRTPKYRAEYHTETYQDPVYVDVPVYDTKYYYNIERWVFDHNEVASGDDGRAYYPEVVARDGGTREGGRAENYWVIDEKGKQYAIDYDLWSNLSVGQTIKVKVRTGKIISIE